MCRVLKHPSVSWRKKAVLRRRPWRERAVTARSTGGAPDERPMTVQSTCGAWRERAVTARSTGGAPSNGKDTCLPLAAERQDTMERGAHIGRPLVTSAYSVVPAARGRLSAAAGPFVLLRPFTVAMAVRSASNSAFTSGWARKMKCAASRTSL